MADLDHTDLMLSILALDAYTRGPDSRNAINWGNTNRAVGTAAIQEEAHEDLPDDRDVPLSDTSIKDAAIDAGFGATSYSWNGKTVIAYRGTDFDFST